MSDGQPPMPASPSPIPSPERPATAMELTTLDLNQQQLTTSKRNWITNMVGVLITLVVGMGLFYNGAASRYATQEANRRQAEAFARQDTIVKQENTDRLIAVSRKLIADDTWRKFNQFYFQFSSQDRLRVLDYTRFSQPINPALAAMVGEDYSAKRKEFSDMWWRVTNAVADIARALRTETADSEELLQMNAEVFGIERDVVPDHPTAIFDRLLSDLRSIKMADPNIEKFRERWRTVYVKSP